MCVCVCVRVRARVRVCVCVRALCLERAIATFLALEFPIISSLVFPWGSPGNTWVASGAVEYFRSWSFQGNEVVLATSSSPRFRHSQWVGNP